MESIVRHAQTEPSLFVLLLFAACLGGIRTKPEVTGWRRQAKELPAPGGKLVVVVECNCRALSFLPPSRLPQLTYSRPDTLQ